MQFGGLDKAYCKPCRAKSHSASAFNQVGAISKINQVTNEFIQKHNRRPSIHELAELTGIDEARIHQSQNADNHHMSIDAPFSDDAITL